LLATALAQEEQLRQQQMAYTKKTFNTWPVWCHQRGSRATTADTCKPQRKAAKGQKLF